MALKKKRIAMLVFDQKSWLFVKFIEIISNKDLFVIKYYSLNVLCA